MFRRLLVLTLVLWLVPPCITLRWEKWWPFDQFEQAATEAPVETEPQIEFVNTEEEPAVQQE